MYSQAISSKPRTVIKGKMCLSSLKLSIQMPFFSCRLDLHYSLSFGTSVYCAIICLFMAGFLGAYSVFKMAASKQTPKLAEIRSLFIDSKILMSGEKFITLEPSLSADLKLARIPWRLYEMICPGNESGIFARQNGRWVDSERSR